MNVIDALEWRYATKKFDPDKELSPEKIDILKKAFNLTATSYGLQPIKLLVIKDREVRTKLRSHSWNQAQVSDASHLLVFCIETVIDKDYIVNYFNRVREIRDTPEKILDPFKNALVKDFEKKSDEEIKSWAANQAYLCMGNLLTVCAVEGIDACPMEGFSADGYDQVLNLSTKGLRPVLVMPVGHRADDDFFAAFKKVRKTLDECIIEL
ncbi:NAD(P)H-dependent oxidoreductase [Robertkochia solimangrovi]|uniref:NAD(P)H-dependent oxidoreductase n=1 Tax=Robertkochia solimangrovi TaxID=2213046 RepID=UPI0011815BD0|nr:NAD(P)H-dependent oxidoreductase [Robertkochia solimangrovi]TRZ42260.1 NAD(P)H-dependent oxidoreductase [Robertkochia solimangrovi]